MAPPQLLLIPGVRERRDPAHALHGVRQDAASAGTVGADRLRLHGTCSRRSPRRVAAGRRSARQPRHVQRQQRRHPRLGVRLRADPAQALVHRHPQATPRHHHAHHPRPELVPAPRVARVRELAPDHPFGIILPVSVRPPRSTTAGTPCMDARSVGSTARFAAASSTCPSRRRPGS